MRRYLLLEDGSSFEGKAFGSCDNSTGELVFNSTGNDGCEFCIQYHDPVDLPSGAENLQTALAKIVASTPQKKHLRKSAGSSTSFIHDADISREIPAKFVVVSLFH